MNMKTIYNKGINSPISGRSSTLCLMSGKSTGKQIELIKTFS